MRKFVSVTTEYIRPSRSIDVLYLESPEGIKPIYIYNHEGQWYYYFHSLLRLIQYFESGLEAHATFTSEADLDDFLERVCQAKNLRLNYRYRDAQNYKEFGSVVFSNLSGMTIEEATLLLKEKLISEEFFVPQDWGLPRLHTQPYNPEVDHEWHEFEEFELTDDQVTDGRDIGEFLEGVVKGYEV